MKPLFPPELRTMAIVPRWSIVHVTQRDTVANHSYFVTIYAHMIARVIKWNGPKDHLMLAALLHDLDETITGDIVSPLKSYVDNERLQDFVDNKVVERFGPLVQELTSYSMGCTDNEMDEVDCIIKAADRLDAVLFLIMEMRRGNSTVATLVTDATRRLEAAWRALPAGPDAIDFTWQTVVLPALKAHEEEGGKGI